MDSFKSFNEQNWGPNCSRCGKPMTLATALPRYGDTPLTTSSNATFAMPSNG
jgi:hypothetical protein